jgi:hypothetical protein
MGERISTGEVRNTQRNISATVTFSTTNPTQPGLGSKAGIRGDRPATNHLNHGVAILKTDISLNCI